MERTENEKTEKMGLNLNTIIQAIVAGKGPKDVVGAAKGGMIGTIVPTCAIAGIAAYAQLTGDYSTFEALGRICGGGEDIGGALRLLLGTVGLPTFLGAVVGGKIDKIKEAYEDCKKAIFGKKKVATSEDTAEPDRN